MSSTPAAEDFAYLSATAARAALVAGKFSAVDYVSGLLARIERSNGHLHAFLSLAPELAFQSARKADHRRAAGLRMPPLHGIPFAVKDLIDVRGQKTSAHSRLPAVTATKTAAAVLRLQRQGGIYLVQSGAGVGVIAYAEALQRRQRQTTRKACTAAAMSHFAYRST